MTTRRAILRNTVTATFGLLASSAMSRVFADAVQPNGDAFKGTQVFDRILKKALDEKWDTLPIGQTMGHVAMEFQGTPYVGFTLELSKDKEFCSINLTGLDCVTFFEDTLDFARMLKKGGRTPEAMLAEVTFTRYRGGTVGDFTSRLHYTTDWYHDNEEKKIVKILNDDLPGAEPFTRKVGIMSQHPENYRQLKAHPELIPKIKEFEDQINARQMKYIPLDKIKDVEPMLQMGDIIGVVEEEAGIDIGHTGLIYVDDAGVRHFMDASSLKRNMKVTLEPKSLHEALTWSKKLTGAMFVRPLEV